jgi:hypothetical protein
MADKTAYVRVGSDRLAIDFKPEDARDLFELGPEYVATWGYDFWRKLVTKKECREVMKPAKLLLTVWAACVRMTEHEARVAERTRAAQIALSLGEADVARAIEQGDE